ncbi:hypothetical protein JCM33374_g1590 [Metschnikowia sp. JCM 33374]|nr:hypothetical protein JCM33374_g1590 [Metschnikowia sp. JCM 33374]
MVLLNGIKYACERCIRGHRVSSCSHTDKPLVMIKPKGRPASQCSHCREQRKVKNAHTSCNCGKKGKSPGQHLASCLCHKNSHCTCVSKEKKPSPAATKKRNSPEAVASDSGYASQSEASQTHSDILKPANAGSTVTQDSDFLIEDIALPFDHSGGLLDFFSSSKSLPNDTPEEQHDGRFQPQQDFGAPPMQSSQSMDSTYNQAQQQRQKLNQMGENAFSNATGRNTQQDGTTYQVKPQNERNMNYFPYPPTDADLDLMENMFPLFPLVGFNSFENDKSLPLSGLPEEDGHSSDHQNVDPRTGRSSVGTASSAFPPSQKTELTRDRSGSAQATSASIYSNQHSTHPSSASLSNMNMGPTHHPRPLRPSSSFSGAPQNIRPKRPESVMSAASTSSNTSKHNLIEAPPASQHQFPKTPSSAAFPPFNLSDNNSTDDFHHVNFSSPGLFNENRSLPILSDEEAPRSGNQSGNVTPQPTMPSRQLSQSRRKTSLSRSHSQRHHNAVSKEHSFLPVKAGSSSENSPRQMLENKFANYDENMTFKHNRIDSYLREVAEESSGYFPNGDESPGTLQESTRADVGSQKSIAGQNALANDDFNMDNPDFQLIPMYHELFEPMQNGV